MSASKEEFQTIEFQFLGQTVRLKSGANPDIVRSAVDLATLKLKDSERRTRGAAPHYVALLALLDLAEEFVKTKERAIHHRNEINEKTSKLLALVDSELNK